MPIAATFRFGITHGGKNKPFAVFAEPRFALEKTEY
jgi:hypothetical protein